MYARIVVGTDGSARARRAVPVGTYAAEAFGCPLELVHVPAAEDAPDLDLPGVRILPGSAPADGLVTHALTTDPPGLLCLSSRGRSSVGEVVFGSVTSRVIRTLHAPMLTVGPALVEPSRPWRRVLVCLDGSTNALAILPVVADWAGQLGLDVRLLHVAYPLGEAHVRDVELPDEDRAATEQLAVAAGELGAAGIEAHWSVEEHTQIGPRITDQAVRVGAGLIALATHGRTGLARLIAGSTALEVVRRATVPVLTVRPEQLR